VATTSRPAADACHHHRASNRRASATYGTLKLIRRRREAVQLPLPPPSKRILHRYPSTRIVRSKGPGWTVFMASP
jgi:hypothetical protein